VISYKGPLLLGALVALLSAIVLVGRAVDGAWLVGIVSNPVTVNLNAILGLMLCGIGLALAAHVPAGRGVRMLSKAIAAFVITGAAATLSQDLFGWNFPSLERMSPSAAYCFILVGSALWVANRRHGSRYQMPAVMALGAVVILTAILSLGLHATSDALHTVLWNYSGIAIYASIGFLLLGLGLIAIALARQPFSWSLGAYTTAGFAAGTAILLLTTWLSTHSIVASQEDMAALARSHEILTEIEEIEAKVVGLDNDQRAYLLDGNSSHLDDQATYINPLWAHLASLRQLTAGDSFHGGRLDRIGPLIAERTQRADRSLETLRREGQAAGMASFTADLAAGLSAEIQRLRGEMERHEHAVLARFEVRARQRQDTAFLQLPLGLLLSMTIVAFGLLLLDERTREQLRSERTLRASETRLRLFVDRTPAAIAMVDTNMRYLAVSQRWLTDYRLGERDIMGLSHYEVFPDIPESWKEIHRRCLAGAVEKCDQDVFPRGDGRTDWLRWEVHPWHRSNGEIGGIILFSELITEKVDATERIRRLNRVHTVLSSVHSLIVRARSRRELFQEACRIAVREGLFAFAWIAAVNRQTGKVETAASSGAARAPASLVFDMPVRLDENLLVVNDVQVDPRMAARRANMDAGVRSLAALPIVVGGEVVAMLELQSAEADLFDDQERPPPSTPSRALVRQAIQAMGARPPRRSCSSQRAWRSMSPVISTLRIETTTSSVRLSDSARIT
jgi:PAS domain S-box-containing protein